MFSVRKTITETTRKTRSSAVAERPMMHHEYFVKSLQVTQEHWKWHHLIDRIQVPIGVP